MTRLAPARINMKAALSLVGVPFCLAAAVPLAGLPQFAAKHGAPELVIERSIDDGPLPLPKDEAGRFVVAESVPFTVVLRSSELALARRVTLTADRDLGDPERGGVRAGEDLSFLATRSTHRGIAELSLEFEAGSDLLPEPGDVAFTVVVEGWSGLQAKLQQTAHLSVQNITSLRAHVLPIFATYCWACHGASTKFEGLELTLTGVFTTAVNVRAHETPDISCATLRLKPFEPDASYLVHKIQGTHLGGCVMGGGERMPQGGPYLSQVQIDVIRAWILQGCRND
jgi:mono/diheme cytochrome c family protein